MSESQRFQSPAGVPDGEGDLAGRLRALAASPADPESMRRGLLWVAGEVQACEQALGQATEQMAAFSSRLAALEARENATARATAGIDSFRREFAWLTGEVQARSDALTRANDRIAALEARGASVEARGAPMSDVRGEINRYSNEVSGAADFAELARAALRSALLEGAVRELREEMEKVTHDLLTNQQAAMAHVAGRTAPLEGALHELRRELDRVAGETAATNHAVRSELFDHVTALDQRLQGVETIQSDLDGVYREIDRLSVHISGGDGIRADVLDRLRPLEDAVLAAREELLAARGTYPSTGARFDADEQEIVRRLDALADLVVRRLATAEDDVVRRLATAEDDVALRLATVEDDVIRRITTVDAEVVRRLGTVGADVVHRLDAVEQEVVRRLLAADEKVALRLTTVDDQVTRRLEGVAAELDGVGHRIDVAGERIDLAEERLDMVGERVNGVDERLAAMALLTSDIEGMYRELDRVAELTLSRDSALAQIADRTTPLEISVANLRQELDRLAGEVLVAQQGALSGVGERIDGVAERLGPLEMLVDQVAELGHELQRVSEEAGSAQQAALAATTEQLGLAGRLRVLESLPADIEGMYRDFERVAEATAARDDRQGDVFDRQLAVDNALADLRAELERVANQGQNTELDLRRRLAGLESVTSDLDALYRELGRVTALATDHEDRSAGFEATVSGVRDSLGDLRERIENERIYTTEQVSGLWARMRAVEGIPTEVDRVSTEIEKLAEAVSRALGDSNESLDSVAHRVGALESLPTDVEGLTREIEHLADAARRREEQVAGLRSQIEPLSEALVDLRREIDRVRTEITSMGAARLSEIDGRIGRLESLPETVDVALRDLTRASDEVAANHQASLASASVLLQDFNDRLRALEALPADMEGLYAALYRVAESVKALHE